LIAFGFGEESSGFDGAAAFARDDDTVEATGLSICMLEGSATEFCVRCEPDLVLNHRTIPPTIEFKKNSEASSEKHRRDYRRLGLVKV
jgi:hypothetical protein